MECVARYDFIASRPDELSFREKDVVKVIIDPEKSQEDDWATAELRGKTGMIPKNYISNPEWFFRGLSRAQAELILMDGQPDGAFLIRESESSPGDFSLSVKFGTGVQHFKILVDKGTRKVFLWEKKFDTINKLVNHFREKSVSRSDSRILLKDMIKKKSNMESHGANGVASKQPQQQQQQQPQKQKYDASHGTSSANGFPGKQSPSQKQGGPWPKVNSGNNAKVMRPPVEVKPRVKALYDFEPQDDSELELKAGDIVEVLDNRDHNWWMGRLRMKKGLFPSTYVQELK